jgi:hypothetical protein
LAVDMDLAAVEMVVVAEGTVTVVDTAARAVDMGADTVWVVATAGIEAIPILDFGDSSLAVAPIVVTTVVVALVDCS